MIKRPSSFFALNCAQFCSALCDNLYKLLLVFFVINLSGYSHRYRVLVLSAVIFVIPFIVFSPVAGFLSDRLRKRSIIYCTRILEICAMALGVIAFFFSSIWGVFVVLFLTASFSAFLGPAKSGIIPEIVPANRIAYYNGVMNSATYLAIILGPFLASLLLQIFGGKFLMPVIVCLFIAFIGFLFSSIIQQTEPQAKYKKKSVQVIASIRKAAQRPHLLTVIISAAFFLFLGSYTQMSIIPLILETFKFSETVAGYVFVSLGCGVGLGSLLVGRLSGKNVELCFIPIFGMAMSLCFVVLSVFVNSLIGVICVLFLTGLFGGFFVVPAEAFVQIISPAEDRGQNVSLISLFGFFGIVVSGGFVYLFGELLELSARAGFLIIGGMVTFAFSALLCVFLSDQILRFAVEKWVKLFCNVIRFKDKKLEGDEAMLLWVSAQSWSDVFVMMALQPRLVRYVVALGATKNRFLEFSCRILRLICWHEETSTSSCYEKQIEKIATAVQQGESICVISSGVIKKAEDDLLSFLVKLSIPILKAEVSRSKYGRGGFFSELKSLAKGSIQLSLGGQL